MNTARSLAGLGLALALPLTVGAADLNWSYLDVRYTGYEEPSVTGDGFGVTGSYAVGNSVYVIGAYDDLGLEILGFDADGTLWRIGLGTHRAVNGSTEIFSEISYETVELSIGGFSADDNGYGFRIGLRGFVTEAFEASGGLRYIDTGASDTLLGIAGVYHLNDRFAVTANYEDGDATIWAAGIRIGF